MVAPGADEAARAAFAAKPNLRLLLLDDMPDPRRTGLELRTIAGGLLAQDRDAPALDPSELRTVTRRAPSEAELADLLFAWTVVRHVRSNAIVLARDGATVGIGAGQMSRVDSVELAVRKAAANAGSRPSVLASDAFFPFPDGLEAAAAAGVTAVIQPGGSRPRRRGDRGGGPGRDRDGVHRPAPLPALRAAASPGRALWRAITGRTFAVGPPPPRREVA